MYDPLVMIIQEFKGHGGSAVIAAVSGIVFAVALIATLAAFLGKYVGMIVDILPVRPWVLITFGAAFGVLSAVAGALPYIVIQSNPGSLSGTWPPDAHWLAGHASQWIVKLIRTGMFGLFLGGVLSLLLTESAMAGFYLSKSSGDAKELRQITIYVPGAIVVLAVLAVFVGGDMSESGRVIADIGHALIAPTFGGAYDAREHMWFGSGICSNLKEFDSPDIFKTLNLKTGNNICDVGLIRTPYIILCVGIFVSLWMAMIYGFTMSGSSLIDWTVRKKIIFRISIYSILSIGGAIGLTWFIEPWGSLEVAEGRQMMLESKVGLVILGVLCSIVCLLSVLLITRDIRAGVIGKSTR